MSCPVLCRTPGAGGMCSLCQKNAHEGAGAGEVAGKEIKRPRENQEEGSHRSLPILNGVGWTNDGRKKDDG